MCYNANTILHYNELFAVIGLFTLMTEVWYYSIFPKLLEPFLMLQYFCYSSKNPVRKPSGIMFILQIGNL